MGVLWDLFLCVVVCGRFNREHYNDLEKIKVWISVKDKLPEEDGSYLVWYEGIVWDGFKILEFRHKFENYRVWENVFVEHSDELGYTVEDGVTHWQPLPEPPKEE